MYRYTPSKHFLKETFSSLWRTLQ